MHTEPFPKRWAAQCKAADEYPPPEPARRRACDIQTKSSSAEWSPTRKWVVRPRLSKKSLTKAKHSPTNDWDTNAVWVDAGRAMTVTQERHTEPQDKTLSRTDCHTS